MTRPEGKPLSGCGHEQPQEDQSTEKDLLTLEGIIGEWKFTLAEISNLTGIKEHILLTLVLDGLGVPSKVHRPGLSPRQQEVLGFVSNEISSTGRAPTVREIAAGLGITSSSAVHYHLKALEKKGYLMREAERSRTLILLREPPDELQT